MKQLKNIQTKKVRIDFIDNWVDDVAIEGSNKASSIFRIEKMDDDCYWVCFYPNKKRWKRYYFMITGKKLRCDYSEEA